MAAAGVRALPGWSVLKVVIVCRGVALQQARLGSSSPNMMTRIRVETALYQDRLLGRAIVSLAVVIICMFPTIYLFGDAASASDQNVSVATPGLLTTVTVMAWLAVNAAAGRIWIFEPIVTGGLMLMLLFGIRPLVMAVAGEVNYYRWIYIGNTLAEAAWLGFAATIALLVSYELGKGAQRHFDRAIPVRAGTGGGNFTLLYVYVSVLTIFSVGLYLLQLHFYGGVAYSIAKLATGHTDILKTNAGVRSEYLSVAPIFATAGATLLILSDGSGLSRWVRRVWVGFLVTFPAIVFAFAGERRFLIPALGIPLVAYYMKPMKKLPIRRITILILLALCVAVAIPYLRHKGGRAEVGGIVGFPAFAVQHPEMLAKMVFLRAETEMVSVMAAQIKYLQAHGNYYDGEATFGDLLFAPIPSALFPGKPMTARNQMLEQLFGAKCSALAGGICPDFSAVGTFYQDAGWFGAILGMLVLGWGSGRAWRWYRKRPEQIGVLAIVACWTVFLPLILRAGFMPGFAWFLYVMVPVGVGVTLFRLRADQIVAS